MDENIRQLRDLQTVMELQVQGMQEFQGTQLAARDSLRAKDWVSLEKSLRTLDFQAEGLRCLEERRHHLWSALQLRYLGRSGRFLETCRLFPEEFRDSFTQLHRSLKVETLAVRSLGQGLAAYVETAGALIQAVIQDLNPASKGRIYSRNGYLRGGETQPLVLNAHY